MGLNRFIVGIDLGTTNSALAYVDVADEAETPPIRLFQVPQLVDAGKLGTAPALPSFLYLPGPHDLPPGACALPWDPDRDYAVGVFAREQGALVPSRLVASAKSWLCHDGVDRRAAILPWGAPSDVPHVSPVTASARYLQHLAEAWNHEMSGGREEWRLERSDVVLTVPASFDEVARELTVEAARRVGFTRLTLLEEPQAAFYSWVRAQGDLWREQLQDGQTVLVCDVGGGTTDFSLIAVRGEGASMSLERVAVGDHLMLGGDNMDLALARHLERRLVKRVGELSARQWSALVHACRRAKERLLAPTAGERETITIAGRGSRVVGGSVSIDLFRDEVHEIVLDGFFPHARLEAAPPRPRAGLRELGLPYADDPAVTRNLAAFLLRHEARPDAVLFNGGAMKATLVQDRVVEVLADWFGREPEVLESRSLDLAVALGGATYGLARVAGQGVRIRGGSARAYYVGVGGAGERRAVCLLPFGVEEGQEVRAAPAGLALVTGRPVSFPLFASTAPLGHDAGEVVTVDDEVYRELPPLHTVVGAAEQGERKVPVTLGARLNEVGTLTLWAEPREGGGERYELEFSLRGEAAAAPATGEAAVAVGDAEAVAASEELGRAVDLIEETFTVGGDGGPRALAKRLEEVLGAPRLEWPLAVIRPLFEPLWRMAEQRRASADHETAWLNLAGVLLRPGFGDPRDPERIADLWTVYREGILHPDALFCRVAWWVLWRRVAGGLARGQQLELSNKLAPPLLTGAVLKGGAQVRAKKGSKRGKAAKLKKGGDRGGGIHRQELAEMWRAVASLERLPRSTKESLGDVALRNGVAGRGAFAFWALGRIGARVLLYAGPEEAIGPAKAAGWIERLLALDWSRFKGIPLAVTQLARRSGDPERDIDDALRRKVIDRLVREGAAERLVRLVAEVTVLDEAERAQLFGDTLPAGLRLD